MYQLVHTLTSVYALQVISLVWIRKCASFSIP